MREIAAAPPGSSDRAGASLTTVGRGEPNREAGLFGRGLAIQLRCLDALMVRNLMIRYGRGNIGFLWVLLDPMILTVGVMFIWSMLKGSTEHGINLVGFVISGYMPLTLWRHITNAGLFGLSRNSSVFYHRQISAIDCLAATLALEFAGCTAAYVIVVATSMTLGFLEPFADTGAVVLGWMMMASLSIGTSLLICALTESQEFWERFIQPFQYLMLPISGSFFMVDWLPSYAQQIAWYSPLVHCYEMVRHGFFGDSVATTSEPMYVFSIALVQFVLGLWLLERAREATSFR